ncbi:MAG TPA: membrane dipeptidase [Candidatus Limnocylindria bacterium]|nr:membrane dipeptidase [Candidatus Limnocylindria bacterium]
MAFAHWDAYELDFRVKQGEVDPLGTGILPELRTANVEGTVYAVGGDSREHSAGRDDPLLGAIVYSDTVVRELERSDGVQIVRTASDIGDAQRSGRIWFVLGLEGCAPLRGELAVLRAFYRLGIRCVGLTWNGRNEAADGVGVPSPGGLTQFGRDLVKELNALGILIDVSHLAGPGVTEVVELSTSPVVASHSNARVLRDHRRNLTDEQLRLVTSTGGIVGVNFHPTFLSDGDATLTQLAEQIEHLASVVGPDHVALGPDFTYDPWRESLRGTRSYNGVPMDITRRYPIHRPGEIERLHAELDRRGMSDDDVTRIFSSNLVALLERVLSARTSASKIEEVKR